MAVAPYLIRLSVYPYIRKYLLYHFTEPFFVSERGYIPGYIENTLKHPPKLHPSELRKLCKVDYGSYFDFAVGPGIVAKKGCFLTSDDVVKINEVISDLIHDEMFRLITSLSKAKYQVDDSIREFQVMYGFDEDELPFENLKRWYYRERLRVEARKAKTKDVSPQLILCYFEEVASQKQTFTSQMAIAI